MNCRRVSVVVPCLNAGRSVERLVASLGDQRLSAGVSMEILVVDNGSTDDTCQRLRALPVRLLHERRPGPAAARNTGVRAAEGDVIVFMDADTRAAHRDFLAAHLRTLAKGKATISGGPITHDPDQKSLLAFAENATGLFNWHDKLPPRSLTFQPAGNLAFRRVLFDDIGPLDERLLYLEDFEWNARAVRAGCAIYFDPEAAVYITGRESLRAILRKFHCWGLNVRSVYVPGRQSQFWMFQQHPVLFALNAPFRLVNETWVTVKRWFPVYPCRTLCLIPIFLLMRSAWVIGMVAGAGRTFSSTEKAATDTLSPPRHEEESP